MIETPAARALAEQLGRVEERLGRLLISGWRQAGSDAADLRQDADALVEAGLPELASRIAAVAEAGGPGEALQVIALAKSACRLLRACLPAPGAPDGWTPLTPSGKARGARTEALVPISRLLLDGRDVWVCTHSNRNQMLLVEPPFPDVEPVEPAAAPTEPKGVLERVRRQIGRALGGETAPPAPWMRHLLKGKLVWVARYPLGADGDVDLCALDGPEWETEPEQPGLQAFHQMLAARAPANGAPVFPTGGGLRLMELDRDDPAAFVWLDPSAAEAFGRAPTEKVWAIAWTESRAIVPVALVTRGQRGASPRLIHLIPGSPEDVLRSVG